MPRPTTATWLASRKPRNVFSRDAAGLVSVAADVRAFYQTLKAHRVTDFTLEPTDSFYGTDMGVRDPFGNAIRIAQQGEVAQQATA